MDQGAGTKVHLVWTLNFCSILCLCPTLLPPFVWDLPSLSTESPASQEPESWVIRTVGHSRGKERQGRWEAQSSEVGMEGCEQKAWLPWLVEALLGLGR